ncbi:MAG: hypothetical protein ACI9UU_002485 [Candidatus Azotimanducaceae bacterium]|jgi:hypothetical protein
MTPSECRYGDWFAKGEATATLGLPVNQFMGHQSACARHGILPDKGRFMAGYNSILARPSS